MPVSDFLSGIANGTLTEFKVKKGFQVGVRIVVPPYPFEDPDTFERYSNNAAIF
ncbi:MAG: hypothetical protein ABH869_04860 [Candidatus Omnitrophota bacterium]